MSLFNNLTSDESIKQEEDRIGGSGVFDSAIYLFEVVRAYVTKSESEAMAVNLVLKTEDGKEFRSQQYVTSGKEKGCKNYYEKDGTKHYLPGFNMINSLCLLALGKELKDVETEEKTLKLYDFTAKAEVPKKVPVLTELAGQTIYAGVLKQIVDKMSKESNYKEPTGETREQNEIDKFFRARDKLTTAEIRAGETEAKFFETWAEKNTGKVQNRAKGAAAGGTAGAPKAGAAAGAGNKPTKTLFGS